MPPLLPLATRYIFWLVMLTFASGLLINFAGFPNAAATGVILASAPAADIGYQAVKRATRALAIKDWIAVWGVCFGVYLSLQLVILTLVSSPVREGLQQPGAWAQTGLIMVSTAVMMAIFLWVGNRSAGGSAQA